ncbi:hypothetical protein OIV83_003240 [Microbotryomycetes sp. JL201]|nr:hypothetical protein OIV83_003240 [Microbotryomycetes sp. JL201]
MAINFNQILYWAKKAFRFYKKYQKQNQKPQQQQQQQQHSQQPWQQQSGSPYPAPQQQHQQWNASPYPQQGNNHQQQPHYQPQHGGYGAHDGPPTPCALPFALAQLVHARLVQLDLAMQALPQPFPLLSPLHHLILSSVKDRSLIIACPRSATLMPPILSSTWPNGVANRKTFLHTSATILARRPRQMHVHRPPIPIWKPTPVMVATAVATANAAAARTTPPRNSVFWSLPAFLRPAYDVLVGLDSLDPQNQDMANAQNAEYVELRNKAIREADLMGQAFSASKQAYASGDGGRAHDLSVQGKEHQRLKEMYNDQAAEWIFQANNRAQPYGTIDLHGLYVQEAIERTEKTIREVRGRGLAELRIIVGKGIHSDRHVAKIKPAIIDLMERENLTAHLDSHNAGVLVVQLQGQGTGKSSREIIGDLEQDKNNDCVIM